MFQNLAIEPPQLVMLMFAHVDALAMSFTVLSFRETPRVKATMTPSVSEMFNGSGVTGIAAPLREEVVCTHSSCHL